MMLMFSEKEYKSLWKFAFVRNPWDRLVSAFLYLCEGGAGSEDVRWAADCLGMYKDFEDFVKNGLTKEIVDRRLPFTTQVSWLQVPGSRELSVDFVGFYENIGADFDFIRKKLGKRNTLEAKNTTQSKRHNFQEYYSDLMIEKVYDVYREDVEAFGYSFDNTSISNQKELRKKNQLLGEQ